MEAQFVAALAEFGATLHPSLRTHLEGKLSSRVGRLLLDVVLAQQPGAAQATLLVTALNQSNKTLRAETLARLGELGELGELARPALIAGAAMKKKSVKTACAELLAGLPAA